MQLTATVKLQPTPEQEACLKATTTEYIGAVNTMVDVMLMFDEFGKYSSKTVIADLPSAVKNQCCKDARSVFSAFRKRRKKDEKWNLKHPKKAPKKTKLPVLKKPVAVWNNQNYKVLDGSISFPVWQGSKPVRITVEACVPEELLKTLMEHKLGTLRIIYKRNHWLAQIVYELPEQAVTEGAAATMGVDLGLKCPAVCYTDGGKVQFVGNGRKNKTIRRRFNARRKKLGKKKKLAAIRKSKDKEARVMKDIDHKLSRQIVNFAVANGVHTIKLEDLEGVRKKVKKVSKKSKKTSKSRKNNRSISSWSFYRLADYIEYKALAVGIQTVRVNPAYTSQTCPVCGFHNHANDRTYTCSCGFHSHRDLVGAMNICLSCA